MKIKNLKAQLIKLPSQIEFLLYLIKEDLKSSRFFNGFSKLGFDDSMHRSDFSSLVLEGIGFENCTDDQYKLYFTLLDQYSAKAEADNSKLVKYAFDLYVDLVIEKRKLSR